MISPWTTFGPLFMSIHTRDCASEMPARSATPIPLASHVDATPADMCKPFLSPPSSVLSS